MIFLNRIEEDQPSLDDFNVQVERVRTFFEFENTSLMKVTEEIILFNKGKDRTNIPYDLETYRTALRIHDFDGADLVFHSYEQVRFNSQYQSLIAIELPSSKPLLTNEYRLIKLQYTIGIPQTKMREANIKVGLYKNSSMYSFLKECEGYEFKISYSLHDISGTKLASGEELRSKFGIETKKQPSFFEMRYNSKEPLEGYVLLTVWHKIPKSLLVWYRIGIYFGIISPTFIFFDYWWNQVGTNSEILGSNINCYFVLSSITISFLTILKGWIFQKKMDRDLLKYDRRYRRIIIFIIFEVLFIVLHNAGLIKYLELRLVSLVLPFFNIFIFYFKIFVLSMLN